MTRPAEVKIREDSVPGTKFDQFEVGAQLPLVPFTITPDIVDEYMTAIEADRALYQLDGRLVAPPNILALYMTSTVYQKYPPLQGIIMISVAFDFHQPIWGDEDNDIILTGTITEKFEKKGRKYVRWEGRYSRADDDSTIATIENCFSVAE